jgi:hypothetical protein
MFLQLNPSGYIYLSVVVKAQAPISRFVAGVIGEMSKSNMSIGKPIVVQAFGIYRVMNNPSNNESGRGDLHRRFPQRDLEQAHNSGADIFDNQNNLFTVSIRSSHGGHHCIMSTTYRNV